MSDGRPVQLDIRDVNAAAAQLRLGLYDYLLTDHAGLPVYVVTVMGHTSAGKSTLVGFSHPVLPAILHELTCLTHCSLDS